MINLEELIAEYIYKYMITLTPIEIHNIFYEERYGYYLHIPEFKGTFETSSKEIPVIVLNNENSNKDDDFWQRYIVEAINNVTGEKSNNVFIEMYEILKAAFDNSEDNEDPFEVMEQKAINSEKLNLKYSIKNTDKKITFEELQEIIDGLRPSEVYEIINKLEKEGRV